MLCYVHQLVANCVPEGLQLMVSGNCVGWTQHGSWTTCFWASSCTLHTTTSLLSCSHSTHKQFDLPIIQLFTRPRTCHNDVIEPDGWSSVVNNVILLVNMIHETQLLLRITTRTGLGWEQKCLSIKGFRSARLRVPVKPAHDGSIIEISCSWTHQLRISHNFFKYSVWGRNELLNFPLLSSLSLLPNFIQLHSVQESWQKSSFRFSIHAACRPLVWFFMKCVQHCRAAVPLSTSAHSQWIPSSLQNMIPSVLGAKASAVVGFHSGCINSLPAATYSTVSSSWKIILVRFRKRWFVYCGRR